MDRATTSFAELLPDPDGDGIVIGCIPPRIAAESERVRSWIVDGLATSLPSLRMRALFASRPELLTEPSKLIVAVAAREERVVGLLTASDAVADGVEFLHIPIQMIGDRYQRSLLLKQMWRVLLRDRVRRAGSLPDLIALRTCNPAAFAAMQAFTRIVGVTVYPHVDDGATEHPLHATACAIAGRLNPAARFDWRTGVLFDIGRPPDLYPDLPASRRKGIDRYFRDHLTPRDRLLCLLRFESNAAKRRVLRAVGAPETCASAPCEEPARLRHLSVPESARRTST